MGSFAGARGVVMALVIGLFGCDMAPTYEPPVRVALAPWIGYTPLYVARERRLYGDMEVRLAEFSTDFDVARVAADGRAELVCGTFSDILRQRDHGADLKIIAVLDFSKGADGIVARAGIEDVAGLRGKRVAAEVGTLTHFVLLRALERAKVDEGEVAIVNLAMEQALAALEKGEVDAATLWDPFLSKAEAAGARRIFSTAEIPGEVLDVLAAPSSVVETRSRDIERVLRAWNGALDVLRREPEAALPVMAERVDMPLPEIRESLETIELVDLKQNLALFEGSDGGASVRDVYLKAGAFLMKNYLMNAPPAAPEAVLVPSLVRRAAAP